MHQSLLSLLKENIDDVIMTAIDLHKDQRRRSSGLPYIVHPAAVAEIVRDYYGNEESDLLEKAAWLHDAIEDADDYEEAVAIIANVADDRVLDLVRELTHIKDPETPKITDYINYISRLSPMALKIKLSDMLDNLSSDPSSRQVLKYEAALDSMGGKPAFINIEHWRSLYATIQEQKIRLGIAAKRNEGLIREYIRQVLCEIAHHKD